jgi:hypothetical protein
LFFWRCGTLREEYDAKDVDYTAAQSGFDLEQKALQDAIAKLGKDIEKLTSEIAKGNPAPDIVKTLEEKSAETGRLVHEQQIRGIEFHAVNRRLILLITYRTELVIAALFVLVGGGLLAVYGFRNWRTLQLKQDELLDLQLKEARDARK